MIRPCFQPQLKFMETFILHARNSQERNTSSHRTQEDYITQVSEEIEDTVTKKRPQGLSKTASRVLGALFKLDEFPLNPQPRVDSGPVSEISGNLNRENQGTNEDRSQNDPHPEVGVSLSESSQELGPEETSDNRYVKLKAVTDTTLFDL